jgi:hypothetical protein
MMTDQSAIPMTTKNSKFRKRRDPVKTMEILAGCFLILFLLILAAGFIPLSHPVVTRRVAAMAGNLGVDSCSIGRVTVTLWKGVTLSEVVFSGHVDSTASYTMSLDRCVFKGNLASAAIAWFRKGVVLLPISQEKPLRTAGRIIGTGIESGIFRKASVDRAQVEVRNVMAAPVQIKGINADLTVMKQGGSVVQGPLTIQSILVGGASAARNLSAVVSLDTAGVTVTQGKGTALDGKLRCAGRITFEPKYLSALTLSVKNMDLGEWNRFADTAHGYCTGRVDLELAMAPSDLVLDSLRGKGSLSIAHCTLRRFPFQKTLCTMFAFPYFARPLFHRVNGAFTIAPGGVLSAEATGVGDTINLTISGWIAAKGTLSEKISCEFTKAGTRALPEFLRKTLEETRGGERAIRFRIYGKISDPKFEIESKQILQNAVQNLFDNVKSNLQQWLR